MSNTWKWVIRTAAMLLGPILRAMSANIEKELEEFMVKLYKKALATDNPLDDLAMGFLLDMLDIEIPS